MARYVTGMKIAVEKGGYCHFHAHGHTQIVYHTGAGSTRTRYCGGQLRTLQFSKGDAIVYPPGWEKDNKADSAGMDFSVFLDAEGIEKEWVQEAYAIHGVSSPYALFELGELSSPDLSSPETRRREYGLRASALMEALHNESVESGEQPSSRAGLLVKRALRAVETGLPAIKTAKEIAMAVGVSPDYLRHICKAHAGSTLAKLVAKARLARASTMLSHSSLTLKEIAIACGYSSERHLCQVVRKAYGLTPNAFRRRGEIR